MLRIRSWLAFLMATLLMSPLAIAKTWPTAQEGFIRDLRHQRIVRLEIVQLTTLTLDFSQRDSFIFDSSVVRDVYAKQPDANCSVDLDDARRAEILSEFDKYPANFTQESDDIDWRILMLDKENHVWSRVYIGKRYTNAQDVLMIVDGQMMTIDRRFVDFLDNDKTLNRCRI